MLSESQLETADEDVATDESTLSPYVTEKSESTLETTSVQIPKQKSAVSENDTLSSSSRCSTPLSNPKGKKIAPKMSRDAFYRGFDERAQKRMELLEDIQKKKRMSQSEEDEVDLFMKSISLSVKKLPPALVNEAKLKILTLVNELQEKAMSSFTLQTPLGIASSEEYPHRSNHYNNAPVVVNTTSISRNSQPAASTIQSHASQLQGIRSLDTYSRQLPSINTGPPSGSILFGTSYQPNNSSSLLHSYQAQNQNSSFIPSNSQQPTDENIDIHASYQQLN